MALSEAQRKINQAIETLHIKLNQIPIPIDAKYLNLLQQEFIQQVNSILTDAKPLDSASVTFNTAIPIPGSPTTVTFNEILRQFRLEPIRRDLNIIKNTYRFTFDADSSDPSIRVNFSDNDSEVKVLPPARDTIAKQAAITDLSTEFKQRLISWCQNLHVSPLKISRNELEALLKNPADKKLKINEDEQKLRDGLMQLKGDFSIFINDNSVPFLLTSANDKLTQWSFDFEENVPVEMMIGQNLVTNEKVVVKVETLSDDPVSANMRIVQLNQGADKGKKDGVVRENAYLQDVGQMKNFQFLTWPKGKQLIYSVGSTQNSRFNPYGLREDEKIAIAQKIIEKLKELHFSKNILLNNIDGNNILIDKTNDSIEVRFINFEHSEHLIPKGNELYTISGKPVQGDVDSAIKVIIESLDLKHQSAIQILKNFAESKPGTALEYEKLNNNLTSCKSIVDLGFDLFKQNELPPAIPPNNQFCLLIHNVEDGIGDFMHGWELAKNIKKQLNEKGYEVFALVETFHHPDEYDTDGQKKPDTLATKNAKTIAAMLESKNSPFDSYLLFDDELKKKEIRNTIAFPAWKTKNQAMLEKKLPHIMGALAISYPTDCMHRLLGKNVNTISCFQYGFTNTIQNPADPYSNPLTEAYMGLPEPSNPNCPGLKLNVDPFPTGEQRSKILLDLKSRESDFVTNLLGAQAPEKYFESHHFMPAYMQTKNATCAFVLTHVLQYKDDGKICDFSIPRGVVDQNAIKALLIKAGIKENEIQFISGPVPDTGVRDSTGVKVRIFSYFIKDENDFENLYRISNDGAGCSGDSTISTVFSSPHVPFYEYKVPPIGNFYVNQWLPFIDSCIKEAEKTNDPELKHGLTQLKEYYSHINYLRSMGKGKNHKPEVSPLPGQPPTSTEGQTNELMYIHEHIDDFYQFCETGANLLKDPLLHTKAWPYVSQMLKAKYNLYDSLDSLVKASIILSNTDDQFLQRLLAGSNEVKSLVLKGAINESEVIALSPDIIVLFSNPTIKSLFDNECLTIESMKILFGGMAENANFHQTMWKKINKFEKIISTLPSDDPEIIYLLNQFPIIAVALQTGIITTNELVEHQSDLRTSDVNDLPRMLFTLGGVSRFETALRSACYQNRNEPLVRSLLSILPPENRKEANKIISKLLQDKSLNTTYVDMLKEAKKAPSKIAEKSSQKVTGSHKRPEEMVFSTRRASHAVDLGSNQNRDPNLGQGPKTTQGPTKSRRKGPD